VTESILYETEDPNSRHIDVNLWWRVLRNCSGYRGATVTMVASGLVIAALETSLPLLTAGIIDATIAHDVDRVVNYGVAYLIVMVCFAVLVWWFIRAAGRLATGLAFDFRERSFGRLQELPFSYFDTRSSGWLVARVTSDVRKITDNIPWLLLDFAWGGSMIVGIVGAMLVVNFELGLAVTSIIPPLALATWWFKRRILKSSRRMRRANSKITAGYTEMIQGVKTTRMLVREDAHLTEFSSITTEMHDWSIRNALQAAVYLPAVMSLGAIGVGIALWQGGVRVQADTGLTLGVLIAFMQYAVLFSEPIQELAQRFVDLQSAQAAAERVLELLDEKPTIADSAEVQAAIKTCGEPPNDGGDLIVERVAFEHVSHEYKPGEVVLRDVSFVVDRGMTVALVGPTGGGKSTIVSLLARWYEPTTGSVRINDVDYRERGLDWWQSQFGVVQQVPHLFAGTIRENVVYGRLNATDDDVFAALACVGASFVTNLDLEVGEGGDRLSMGERQLISLARAMLADPQIFIMDEATSSVDTETEAALQSAIDHVLSDRIAFVVAHRLSTIREADLILVVLNGEIVERGTHKSLLEAMGHYYGLYNAQFLKDAEARVLADSSDKKTKADD
jgi:ATP-binding cassette subfamily B protein